MLVGEGTFDPPTKPLDGNGQGNPYATYAFAAQMAEVEVDTELGTVKVPRIAAAHDVGRAINPIQVEGQIHGGIAQGLGLALMEEYLPGRTENLHDYLIPTFGDVPPIEVSSSRMPSRSARSAPRAWVSRAGADRAGDPGRDPPCLRRAPPVPPSPTGCGPLWSGARRGRAAMSDEARPRALKRATPARCCAAAAEAGACDRYANVAASSRASIRW